MHAAGVLRAGPYAPRGNTHRAPAAASGQTKRQQVDAGARHLCPAYARIYSMVKSGRTWAPAPQAWPCVVNSNDSWAPLRRSADRMRSILLICGRMPDFPGGQLAQTGCVRAQQGMLLTINALTRRLQYPGPNEIDHQSAETRNVCPGHSRIDHRRAAVGHLGTTEQPMCPGHAARLSSTAPAGGSRAQSRPIGHMAHLGKETRLTAIQAARPPGRQPAGRPGSGPTDKLCPAKRRGWDRPDSHAQADQAPGQKRPGG